MLCVMSEDSPGHDTDVGEIDDVRDDELDLKVRSREKNASRTPVLYRTRINFPTPNMLLLEVTVLSGYFELRTTFDTYKESSE